MKPSLLILTAIFLGPPLSFAQGAKQLPAPAKGTNAAVAAKAVEKDRTPDSYKRRQAMFHAIMARESTRERKVAKAIALAQDPRSDFRIDAVNFLADTHSKEALPALQGLVGDRGVREFVIYALGEILSEKSIPPLIGSLSDPDENVRGNAERAIRKITRMNFAYRYSDPPAQRKRNLEAIQKWWDVNGKSFKVQEESPEEKKAAEEAWEKFGKPYVYDLKR